MSRFELKMNKLYVILILSLLFFINCEDKKNEGKDNEELTYTFIKTFGGNEDDNGESVQQTPDDEYVIFGCKINLTNIAMTNCSEDIIE